MTRLSNHRRFKFILCFVLAIHAVLLSLSHEFDKKKVAAAMVQDRAIKVTVLPGNKQRLLSDKLKQIVDSEDPAELKKPENAKYYSDKNRTFDRQSVARRNGIFQKRSGQGSGPRSTEDISLGELGHPAERHPLLSAAKEYAKRGSVHSPGTGRSVSSAGGTQSQTNDYIEGVPLGDLTYLNTQEHKYYGFYHRIKQKLNIFFCQRIIYK